MLMGEGDLKGRPERSEGKKVSGGHFFSPWENPSLSGCGPEDCKREARTMEIEYRWSRRRPLYNFCPPEGRKCRSNPSISFMASVIDFISVLWYYEYTNKMED